MQNIQPDGMYLSAVALHGCSCWQLLLVCILLGLAKPSCFVRRACSPCCLLLLSEACE